jgi:hypothetical protein
MAVQVSWSADELCLEPAAIRWLHEIAVCAEKGDVRTNANQAMNDPIVDEVRRVRDDRERKAGLKFVQGVAGQPEPPQALQPTGAAPPHPAGP